VRSPPSKKDAETDLNDSHVTHQLLQGRITEKDIHSIEKLDEWISSKPNDSSAAPGVNLQNFNKQQQRVWRSTRSRQRES
jgi:hypothetical protein